GSRIRAVTAIPRAQGHWLLGSAREMAGAPHRFPAELGWKHGGLAWFRILNRRCLLVAHPDLAAEIFLTHHAQYERSFQYRNQQVVVGKGLISTDGPLWLKRRRQVLPAFRADTLKRIVPVTCAAAQALTVRWGEAQKAGRPVSAVADMRWLTMRVIG